MALAARRIMVHGMVQGVGFRYFVQRVGKRLGLAGNVRNLPDSTVEIMVEGDSPKIERFIEEVRKGPPMAWVEKLDIEETVPARSYPGFLIEGW